ncbi:SCO family protein [Acidocella sp.]|uniref:SCO family protein n=2 Tax=Acidocella sp. TaxID=50710 RepID=UPI00262AB30B|nr:SCO family protein [Acidocella sp.]
MRGELAIAASGGQNIPMFRRLLFCAFLALTGCHHNLSPQDVSVRGLVPPLAFTMTDAATGKLVTAADFRGAVTLLYFGYTNCPDVCPATLYNLDRIETLMGPDAARIKILFVTVDPHRDTAPLLTQYVRLFGANLTGLRGTADQLYQLARRYRVVFSVSQKPTYTVTHSAAVYVFNGKGKPEFIIAGLDTSMPDLAGIARDLKDVAQE